MAISSVRLRIPYISEGFPAATTPNTLGELSTTWDEILWAALTVGRPSTFQVFQHGLASGYEAVFRISLIRMALEQHGPLATRLRRTTAFKGLDPTEKGAISYFLGMAFCKLFASRMLATPWLLHLDIYRSNYSASYIGRSRPDLFGQQTGTKAWHAFETKGRSSRPSAADRIKAKDQASRLISVGGTACTLHVGAFTYFVGDVLKFHWSDPPPESKKPLNIPEIGDGWRYYYEPIWSLWGRDTTVQKDDGELVIPLSELDLKIRIHAKLTPSFVLRLWERAQREMSESYEELAADGFQADGVKVECGKSWFQRRSGLSQSE